MDKQSINIITAADDKFGRHAGTMLFSLLKNYKGNSKILHIYILDGGVKNDDKLKIISMCKEYLVSVQFISVNTKSLNNARVDGHVSIATYFRILIPSLISNEVEKVLYLDSDIIVLDDISNLYNINVDKYYAAAALDPGTLHDGIEYINKLGLPSFDKYFNAGVLLINLKKWREENIQERLIMKIKSDPSLLKTWDQDALNSVLWNKLLILHPRFNVMAHFFNKQILKFITDNNYKIQIREAQKKPMIIHYNTYDKPWMNFCSNPLKSSYRYYLKLSPWKKFAKLERQSISKVIKMWILRTFPITFVKHMINLKKKISKKV